jgi:hypothetical protein
MDFWEWITNIVASTRVGILGSRSAGINGKNAAKSGLKNSRIWMPLHQYSKSMSRFLRK